MLWLPRAVHDGVLPLLAVGVFFGSQEAPTAITAGGEAAELTVRTLRMILNWREYVEGLRSE